MRIQHNIPAMSAYRNYTTNNSAINKNLEKLSSGYKINRAGDDAAGLAISEKMRIQITGLEQAQANAKSGINLIQTAEGALTEVHDMLNRMYTLAEQSANGTYSNEVDREQLQKEVESLRTEIDRISDATNYNGINLLDGSLSTEGGAATVKPGEITGIGTSTIKATKASSKLTLEDETASKQYANGDTITIGVGLSDGTAIEITLTAKVDADNKTTLVGEDDKVYGEIDANGSAAGDITNDDLADAFVAAMNDNDDLGENFKISADAGVITLEAKEEGADGVTVTSFTESASRTDYMGGTTKAKREVTEGKNDITAISFTNVAGKIWPGMVQDPEDAIFEINGKKFAILGDFSGTSADGFNYVPAILEQAREAFDSDVTLISGYQNNATLGGGNMADIISQKTGLDVKYVTGLTLNGAAGQAALTIEAKTSGVSGDGGLKLQIGDTADEFNQLTVSIKDMHAKAMGIGSIDISKQKGASKAMDAIKEAVNYVSDVRGDLGALQNRLDHTISNLSVTQENIQDAESTIRDVDIAEEMMAYTKNNILVQSAQAMLAQANQLPQGVLQLLQ